MNPADIGFPPKFSAFWPGQLEAAIHIASSNKRFYMDAAPTGAGKSIIYITTSQLMEARTCILTANKGLQLQVETDFNSMGVVDIRGQANYPCVKLQTESGKGYRGCDEGPCHFGKPCELHPRSEIYKAGCGFYDQLARARKARIVVTNYDFWMTANRYMEPGVLGKFDLLILDEAHDAPDKLSEFCSIRVSADECEMIDSAMPPTSDGVDAWGAWAEKYRVPVSKHVEWMKEQEAPIDELRPYISLKGKLEVLSTAQTWHRSDPTDPEISMPGVVSDWVAERNDENTEAVFSPVWAHRYAETYLFARIPKVVLVSATISPKSAAYLGVAEREMEYHEHPAGYAVNRRPVYTIPAISVGRNNTESEMRLWVRKIDQIIESRLDRKGIIHTVSYDRMRYLTQNSKHRRNMIWHNRATLREKITQFKRSKAPSILVSPSVSTGFDFPYSECEYQIVAKVPFVPHHSEVMKARAKSDKTYLNYAAAIQLTQMCGRGMRAADDRCETFIVDNNAADWFIPSCRRSRLLAPWFLSAIRKVISIPPAPPRLTK